MVWFVVGQVGEQVIGEDQDVFGYGLIIEVIVEVQLLLVVYGVVVVGGIVWLVIGVVFFDLVEQVVYCQVDVGVFVELVVGVGVEYCLWVQVFVVSGVGNVVVVYCEEC